MKENVIIGISIGDINGIGLEVIAKTFKQEIMLKWCTPIIYANKKYIDDYLAQLDMTMSYNVIESTKELVKGEINVIEAWTEEVNIQYGQITTEGGKFAFKSLDKAVSDLKVNDIDALVTAPIHKKAMQLSGFKFPGHTEYLTEKLEAGGNLMFMVNDDVRVGLVTNHLPVKDVVPAISKKDILKKLKLMHQSLVRDFGISAPKIAILGLNPHAGDNGAIGSEDQEVIIPSIVEANRQQMLTFGPYPADGFFGSNQFKKFDAVLAMYHDQGLIPFKTLSFGNGVNFTAGLAYVRTSPDHGTGYDIAGQGIADESSFRKAVFMALDIVRKRASYDEMHENPILRNRKVD